MRSSRSSVIRECESRFATGPGQRSRPPAVWGTSDFRSATLVVCAALGLTIGLGVSSAAGEPPRVAQTPLPAEKPSPSTSAPVTPSQVYQTVCMRCHDPDGRGKRLRHLMPELPDFTNPKWQDSRTDAELDRSIRVGTGKWMRPMTRRLGSVELKKMVTYVRAFRDGRQQASSDAGPQPRPSPTGRVATAPLDQR